MSIVQHCYTVVPFLSVIRIVPAIGSVVIWWEL